MVYNKTAIPMMQKSIKYAMLICIILCITTHAFSQQTNPELILQKLNAIKDNNAYSFKEKLRDFYELKTDADKNKLPQDSIYSTILYEISRNEVLANKNYIKALNFINAAIKINISGQKSASKFLAVKCLFRIAKYYDDLGLPSRALQFYDSTISYAKRFSVTSAIVYVFSSQLNKAILFFVNGDYQKAVEESISGMHFSLLNKDSSYHLAFLNQKAQALCFENKLSEAYAEVTIAITVSKEKNNWFNLASALKTKAFIEERYSNFKLADSLFKESIKARIKTNDFAQIATDYNDYGNFFQDSLNDYKNAQKCYQQSIFYGKKLEDSVILARATINIGGMFLTENKYEESLNYCFEALKYLNVHQNKNAFESPSADRLNTIEAKELALTIMNNKIETLLNFFIKTQKENLLSACIQNCLVMDTLITKMRNMQSGTESKLYWRDYTRNLYTNAIQASYLLNRPDYAFYFMEKSRAVLLNDKLNELNASSFLSPADATKQEDYEIKIIELQQKLSELPDSSKQYQALQLQLFNINNDYEQFIKSLEQKYPSYYQYKYADKVASLKDLQQYLAKNQQSFIHYFFAGSVTYILGITVTGTKFLRLSQKEFNNEELNLFLQFCANKQMLNNNYGAFSKLSNSIYQSIFSQLQLPAGRVVICTDNIVIPFEALCKDAKGENFLLDDYSFAYVYSARFLMKQFNNAPAKGNFAGYAPVSFAKTLDVADLKNAASAIKSSAGFYGNDKLFINKNASRSNFFRYAPLYAVVGIFSHAKADTTEDEPVLFMQDSLIYLPELQLLNNPATKLVLLSACQTNVGKAATGEGIYSLARGFATAGIPSVSATLWKADEETIYAISEKFNEYLSEGMNKDEALQKAKLYFIKSNGSEKTLPYYWANMILIGNTDAIKLVEGHLITTWHFIYFCVALMLMFAFIYTKRKIKFRKK